MEKPRNRHAARSARRVRCEPEQVVPDSRVGGAAQKWASHSPQGQRKDSRRDKIGRRGRSRSRLGQSIRTPFDRSARSNRQLSNDRVAAWLSARRRSSSASTLLTGIDVGHPFGKKLPNSGVMRTAERACDIRGGRGSSRAGRECGSPGSSVSPDRETRFSSAHLFAKRAQSTIERVWLPGDSTQDSRPHVESTRGARFDDRRHWYDT
jgi:hypothetical protein